MPAVFSFDFGHRFIDIASWRIAFLVYSEDNVFTPDPRDMTVERRPDGATVTARRLAFAGLQQSVQATFRADIRHVEGGFDCSIETSMNERIKGTTLLIRDRMPTHVPSRDYADDACPAGGALLKYPASIRLPVFPLRQADGTYTAVASLDEQVRSKTVAVVPAPGCAGEAIIELHHHEDARHWSTRQQTPTWRVLRCSDPRPLFDARCEIAERCWGLKTWDAREDVPAWMRGISLVLNLHGTHWTGYIFNTYEQQLAAIRYVAERIEGSRVLAYLPAWDGRYNYNWPRYEPDERMGGEAGLRKLVDEAHKLGVRLIPQIGAVSANRRFLPPGLHDCASQDSYGNVYVKEVDWDNDRAADTYRVNANLGHPGFLRFLLDRTFALTDQFGFDGIFLDINMSLHNDPRFSIYEGHRAFAQACHERYRDYLIFGENWYDALMPIYPLVHSVTDKNRGIMQQWADVYDRYCRTTYHLIHPAPAPAPPENSDLGSTGVYEAGYMTPFVPDPESLVIPAISFVHETLTAQQPEVNKRIDAAKAYAKKWGL